jgi:hypothetical protein
MTDNQPNRKIAPRSSGFFEEITNRFRLISRLIMDGRVNPLIKVLPVATLAYVVWPIDLLPVNPIDDAMVLWLGTTLFVELCPPAVVQEHMDLLTGKATLGQTAPPPGSADDVVEGEYFENDPNNPPKNRYP